MVSQHTITFQEVLDIVEALPEHQQENLIDIIRRRLIERGREVISENIKRAREEYKRAEVSRGTVNDLMKEIAE
jgi:cation transport regulator ChaB